MPTLKWKAKGEIDKNAGNIEDSKRFQTIEILEPCIVQDSLHKQLKVARRKNNLLILGDNKITMKNLLEEYSNKIDLIYIDPPFATGGNFPLKINIGEDGEYEEVTSYSDTWKGGIDEYLNFLYERILLMKELLSESGSIYIHLDWHVVHYIKLLMDELFGIENFRNEIIWMYPAASARTRNFFIRSYDAILFYTKSNDYIFNDDPNIYMEYSNRVKNALKEDDKGKFYYRGGSHNGKKLSRKVYIKQDGIFPRDIWNDIPYVRANTVEYQAFATQKPERLLKRIILASTKKNQLVADFFCGSGTTLTAAEKLGRRWIGCDSNSHAINICRKRIQDVEKSYDLISWKREYNIAPTPFEILKIDDDKNNYEHENNTLVKNPLIAFQKGNPSFKFKLKYEKNTILVALTDYFIPFIDDIDPNLKKKVNTFLDWIDYWSIDFNYNNKIFKPDWWSFRTPKNKSLQSESKPYLIKGSHSDIFRIAIKVIDILGIDTLQIYEINQD
jgi:adenine specific DNA methylase Mod